MLVRWPTKTPPSPAPPPEQGDVADRARPGDSHDTEDVKDLLPITQLLLKLRSSHERKEVVSGCLPCRMRGVGVDSCEFKQPPGLK